MLAGADGEPEVACIVVAALFVGNSVIVVVLKLDSCNACCFHTVCLHTVCLHTVCLHTVCFHCNAVSSQYSDTSEVFHLSGCDVVCFVDGGFRVSLTLVACMGEQLHC